MLLHRQAWNDKSADPWVVEVLRWGYRMTFRAAPKLSKEPIPYPSYGPSSIRGKALESKVLTLVKKGAVELAPLPSLGYYSRLFVVMKDSGSWRPVIDLSLLNLKVLKTPFKMETLQSVLLSVQSGDWMVSLDLKDAYLQVPIHPDSRKYLRFIAFGQAYQFKVLCFGLSTAPQGHGSGFDLFTMCRYPHPPLPGRLADPGGLSLSGSDSVGCGSPIVSFSRDCRQLGEVSSGACAADNISWRSSGLVVF